MPLPDPESPEQSLGDCAICMDAILVDPSLRQRKGKSFDGSNEKFSSGGSSSGRSGGLLNAMHVGVGGATARKNYSLAPCHHLFHTECLEKVRLISFLSDRTDTDLCFVFVEQWLAIKVSN